MSRFGKIAEKLPEYGLDAILITGEPNRLYAAEFHSSAGVALVTREESYFFIDSRYIEAAEKTVTGAVVRQCDRENPYSKLINEALAKHEVKTLGFEEEYLTVAEFEVWKKKLQAELVPATKLLLSLRERKDAQEIAAIEGAQRIAEQALEETLNFIQPGRTEQEIAAFLQYQMLRRGAEKMSFDPIVVSGPNSSMPHGVPGNRPVQTGDFITMDFGCVWQGYCSDMTRTVAVGCATEEMKQVYHTVLQAQLAGIAVARAGVSGKDVDGAARALIEAAGFGAYFGHGFGHGIGVEIHEEPTVSPGGEKLLAEGAVISAEPGIYLPGKFGVRIEDMLLITADGCRNLTKAAKELLIL